MSEPHFITPGMDPDLVAALGGLRYGLYFLSTGGMAQPRGLLVSWAGQVSGDPPLVQVALRHNRASIPALQERGAFALNLLPQGDEMLLARLTRPARMRLEGVELIEGPLGLPLLAGGLGAVCCQVVEVSRPGDHLLFLGRVQGVLWRGGGRPLLSEGQAYLGLA